MRLFFNEFKMFVNMGGKRNAARDLMPILKICFNETVYGTVIHEGNLKC